MDKKKEQPSVQCSVVVPVYNSEGTLPMLHRRLEGVFQSLGVSWELLLVNDCSRDRSWEVMKELAEKDGRVLAIALTNNFGQHGAIMCGFHHARGEYVITMDDDLQHPPEEVTKLVSAITEGGYEIVYGQYRKKRHGWFRDMCSNAVNRILARITGSGYHVTSFRILKRGVAERLIQFTGHNVMIDVLIKDAVHRSNVGHVEVEHREREIGTSNYSFRKLVGFALNMIFSYTLWPLRFAAIFGFFFSFLSILLGILILIDYFVRGVPVRGWTSTVAIVTFFSGAILFVLGIVGEYLGRVFLSVNQKPQYFVKEVYGKNFQATTDADNVLDFLQERGHKIAPEVESAALKLQEILDAERVGRSDISHVLRWLEERRVSHPARVEEVRISDLNQWEVRPETGHLAHESGKFFSIIGVRVCGAEDREVPSWDQPMMKQEECGILGVLCQRLDGMMRYLLYAKYEPGNLQNLQLSPTLQATESNLRQAHGGKKPRFAEYFEEGGRGTVRVSVVGVEDGGRFYHKTNRCMIVEVPEDEKIDAPDDYIWLTLPQIKKLLRIDLAMNSLARSVFGSL